MKRSVFAILAGLVCASFAHAGETPWMEIAPDVSLRLVSSDLVTDAGTMWMGLEFDMPEATKTYWRVPGESGIPLLIDTMGSVGVASLDIAWPYPRREASEGYLDHAYYGRTLIPFEIALSEDNPRLKARIDLGICSDVCVPVSADIDYAPDSAPADAANGFRIEQALAHVPLPDDGEGVLGAAVFDAEIGAIIVEHIPSEVDPQTMIAEIDGTMLVFDTPRLEGNGGELVFPLLGRVKSEMLENASAIFTFQTSDGPFEVARALELR